MEMMIHVLDLKTEQIVATLENKNGYPALFWDDRHVEKEENNYNTYEFTTVDDGTNPAAPYLIRKNKIIIRDLDGNFLPFTIEEVEQDSTGGQRVKRIYAEGEHMELRTSKIIEPIELIGATLNTALDHGLQGTRWKRGITEFAGARDIKITEYITALAFLNKIASEFNVQLRFRVEIDGNQIVGRYVDALLTEDVFDGKEITFGKDVIGIRRIENSTEVYTALYAIGPADENGKFITIEQVNGGKKYVEDREALERWSPDGRHLFGIFQYQSDTDEKVTPELLKQKAEEALKNHINSIVKYEVEAVALERIAGLEHEKIRKGMTVRIKDEKFNPPLYLEARVLETERSYTTKDRDRFVLGNYREIQVVKDVTIAKIQSKLFRNENAWSSSARVIRSATPPEDTHAIWIDITKNPEVPMTYDFQSGTWKKASPTVAEEIGAETPTGAQQKAETAKQEAIQVAAEDATAKANAAEQNAKQYAEQTAQQAEQNAKDHADQAAEQAKQQAIQQAIQEAEQKLNQTKTELETEIAAKADATWVNGQLVLKENAITKSSTAPSNPTANQLWLDTSVTPNVLKRWNGSAWVKVTPTSAGEVGAYTKTEVDNALNSKVSVTQYNIDMNGVVTRLNSAESRITQTEQEIATKVSNTTYQQDKQTINNNISQLQTRMSQAETSLQQTAEQLALKANKTDVYTKTEIDGQFSTVNQQISQLDAELTVQAGQIVSKVSKTDLQALTNGVLKVRYIRDWLNGNSVNSGNHWVEIKAMSGTTNRASGKTPTSNYSLSNGSRITDGDTNSANYASGGNGVNQYVQIDLGAVYEDIDYIQVWHYYSDGRTYNGTKVEVSADGTTWTTVFDSAVSGTYKETTDGLIVPINNRVLNSFNTRLSTAESSITQLSNQITLKANKTEVDTLTNRISTAESQINILSDEIELRVEKDGVVSAINQSPESIKIQASKIDITGAVTFSSLSSTLQQSFNADGTVKTSRLSGTISDSQIASAGIWNTIKDRVNSWTVSGKTTINGGLIETNTIFAQQIAIADFTNLCQINELTNPNGHTVVTISNKKYFKIGQAAYSKIKFAESRSVEFKVGDEYHFSFDGYKESVINTITAIVRYYYSDGSWANAGTATVPITTTEGRVSVSVRITTAVDTTKTLSRVEFFLEKDNTATGYYYLRLLELRKKYSGELIVDGVIEARHIKSLNGLNVNNQFIVDANGNVTFKGNLTGATGTFSGNISTQADINVGNNIYIGALNQYQTKGLWFSDKASVTASRWNTNDHQLTVTGNKVVIVGEDSNGITTNSEIDIGDGDITLWARDGITINANGIDGLNIIGKTTLGGALYTDGTIQCGGFDFRLGTYDQSSRGDTGSSRALVKYSGGKLVINYAKDFYGGVEVQSDLTVLGTARATSFVTTSSAGYKTNIKEFNEDAIAILKDVNVYTYHLISNVEAGIYDKQKVGMLAEAVPAILRDEDGVDTYSIVSVLWKAVQQQQNMIESLLKRIDDLELVLEVVT
jgi:phage minor structural protein